MCPTSFREVGRAMSAARGNRWVIRDHDFQIEFSVREPSIIGKLGMDPDFQALQATAHSSYVSGIHTEASLGWVETYIQDGKIVNMTAEGKPDNLGWEKMSAAP
jgi:hypothetical protein